MRGDFRKRLNEPVGERRPARPPRPWIVPLTVGISIAVIVIGVIVVAVTGQRFF